MNTLNDILVYVRRIIKTPNNSAMPDGLIIDYVNRFYINDVPARLQLFDLRNKFNLELVPNIDQYNMPYTQTQTYTDGATTYTISPYPMYQGFQAPIYIDGVQINLMTSRDNFFKTYPNFFYNLQGETGDGATVAFTFTQANTPLVRGHIDVTGISANQSLQPVARASLNSGVFVNAIDVNNNSMILFDSPWPAANLNGTLYNNATTYPYLPPASPSNSDSGYLVYYNYSTNQYVAAGTVDYIAGDFSVTFPSAPQADTPIYTQYASAAAGTPRIAMFWNNIISVRPIPDRTYFLEVNGYLTPAAFLATGQAFQWGYMSEYIARGAARKILSDVGDIEQLQMYEPFFREQEMQVLRRSDRIQSQSRTPTIYTELLTQAPQQYSGQTAV